MSPQHPGANDGRPVSQKVPQKRPWCQPVVFDQTCRQLISRLLIFWHYIHIFEYIKNMSMT
ncbi:hypothetical protein CHH27_20850 [Labrenzia sp. VG12]|nr:hypothetical protein CHH27_20850 [Labrenzia sp. VG12]